MYYLLEPTELNQKLVGQYISFLEYPDGTVAIMHEGRKINYSIFDKLSQLNQREIVENKRLGSVLAHILCLTWKCLYRTFLLGNNRGQYILAFCPSYKLYYVNLKNLKVIPAYLNIKSCLRFQSTNPCHCLFYFTLNIGIWDVPLLI